jgi:methylaspartate mutase epsilon subunit
LTKTPAEATGLPTLADNLLGLDLVRQGLSAPDVGGANEERIAQEVDAIRVEAEALIDGVIHAGHGSIVLGITRAFERGLLDIPFSPSIHNRGDVVPARDADGAVRYASFGRLPFGREIREFNDDRLASRRRTRPSSTAIYGMLEEDVMQVPLGRYEMWPLDVAKWPG